MPLKLANNSQSMLTTGIGEFATTITVLDASSFATLAAGDWMWLTIIDQSLETNFEIVQATALAGNVLTIVRGQEGTTARAAIAGDIVEQRITRQTLLDLGGGEAPEKPRKYLDEIYLALTDAPKFTTTIEILSPKYAPIIFSSESGYNSNWGPFIKFQIQNMDDGTIIDDVEFLTVNDILTWITANVPETGGQCTTTILARPYETIDEAISVVTKMYGLNRFYSSLRGKRRYTTGTGTANNSTDMKPQCAEIYNAIWGTSFDETTIDLTSVWLSAAKKNLYGNPRFRTSGGYRVRFDSGCESRQVRNGAGTAWKTNTASTTYVNVVDTFGWAAMNPETASITTYEYSESLSVLRDHSRGFSCVMICGVEELDNGNGEKAIVIKPMGIDQIVTSLPDFSKYYFEIVFMNDERQAYVAIQRFSSMGDFNFTDFDVNGAKMRIDSNEWLSTYMNASNTNKQARGNWNQFNFDSVRFRLRDKTTNAVSSLSYAGIVTDKTHKLSLRQMRIKNFEHGSF